MKYRTYIFLGLTLLLSGVADKAISQTINIRGNVYGGGEKAQVEGNTTVTVTNVSVPKFKVDTLISNPRYSVFGGGLGATATVKGNTSVDVSITKGSQLFEVIGGGMNGRVEGTCNVHIGSDTKYPIYNVYGGGYYAQVGSTSLVITRGKITNDVYGGGVMGSILGSTRTKIGFLSSDPDYAINGNTYSYAAQKNNIQIQGNVYGANDVSGDVETAELTIHGGTIAKDVYGAGNGNHIGYTNPSHIEYIGSQHQAESYAYVQTPGQKDATITSPVYKSRPHTRHVSMTLQGNEGADLNDDGKVDKVRILGRTFGGGNSCNVGEWNGTQFLGGGSLNITIGSHVQLGNPDSPADDPSGLFMGSNGKSLVTQSASSAQLKYYHYYLSGTTYRSGFNSEASFRSFVDNILTWTDDVHLTIADDVKDVWMNNFVGGGFRGSMKAKTNNGTFDYKLPGGVTVGQTVIGGAYNAYVTYRNNMSDKNPKYTFEGGMLAESAAGIKNRLHVVHPDPRAEGLNTEQRDNLYKTNYFTEATKGFFTKRDKPLVKLHLYNMLQPMVEEENPVKGTPLNVHGGVVYGGCFSSGNIEGDSWVDYSCYLSPLCKDKRFFDKTNMNIYGEVADMERNNALIVFGAGYGANTTTKGDAYLNIYSEGVNTGDEFSNYPYIFNAFGGSNKGTVEGNANVFYSGGKQGTLLGSLYGGGLAGEIKGNTFVELAGGFVVNVYGGSRQADIGGASHVWAYDGKYNGVKDVQHLIICNIYGGNDISGTIHGTMPAVWTRKAWSALEGKEVNSYVEVAADNESADRGFPLVGSAFAGGNGENWNASFGVQPNVENALIEVDGGTTIRAFGGGNMATVTDNAYIFTNAKRKDFAKVTFEPYQKNILNKVFFSGVPVGYDWDGNTLTMAKNHVIRLFGGNNLATMDIQPTWKLKEGLLANVYSGGNMGDMTYYNPAGKPATKEGNIGDESGMVNADGSNVNLSPRGLSITIDEPNIHIGSLFGGCRISDVIPTPKTGEPAWPAGASGEDFYGATINILNGYVENVYGGNDISGTVHHGANVNISGAVSGNVYGSGNGFYIYKWDEEATRIEEKVNPNDIKDANSVLYYTIPANPKFGGKNADATQKILTINAARPSVEKSFLNIAGVEPKAAAGGQPAIEKRVAYVKGNVFCGGNASTVFNPADDSGFTKFKVGSYVTLNGVFMGSDGMPFSQSDHLYDFETINDIDLSQPSTTGEDKIPAAESKYYPNLLAVHMKAVEMKAQPKDFNLNLPLVEAHIGTYCGGGNRGSMLVDKTVELPFHHDIIIYDKIVASCLDANVKYKGITARGGYTRPIADHATYGNTKMNLTIASQFAPLVMDVPADQFGTKNTHGEDFATAQKHNFLYSNQTKGVKYDYEEFNQLFEAHWPDQETFEANADPNIQWKEYPDLYAQACNIYGGCYQSGEVEGDVNINLHTNMLRYVNKANLDKTIQQNIACFNVYGAGFGQDSYVWGNVKINVDRTLDPTIMGSGIAASTLSAALKSRLGGDAKFDVWDKKINADFAAGKINRTYPTFNNVFGGGRNGRLIGNSQIEIRNGLIYSDVTGGCYASDMYGSTHIVVGYPKYWQCNTSAEYAVKRADVWNTDEKDAQGDAVIKQSVFYLKGDLIPDNVYQQIIEADGSKATQFNLVEVDPTTHHATDGTTWNDVFIEIGKGVYGGGYSLANSTAASAGAITTRKLTDTEVGWHKLNFDGRYGLEDGLATIGYGGNSNIMVADQEEGSRDHIHISSYKATRLTASQARKYDNGVFTLDANGKYSLFNDEPVTGHYYYLLSGEGGIYGDGHLTFCEAFRAADVTRYGWAEGTVKYPVLLNTFQRMDLLSVNDCCIMFYGAQDFAADQFNGAPYSVTRIGELRMNSSLNPNAQLGNINGVTGVADKSNVIRQRNYLSFLNNALYLGALVSNDSFEDPMHYANGGLNTKSYKAVKEDYITDYNNTPDKSQGKVEFSKRNVGTARNAIGIDNGYSLRIMNQNFIEKGGKKMASTYYGPIVGVCEMKLLTLHEGEGGGYVFADNIHKSGAGKDDFLMISGNFVFPGMITGNDDVRRYIIDDCYFKHFGKTIDLTDQNGDLDEAHYWYVEGTKYLFSTTLTCFTYQDPYEFNLTENDPNIILYGMKKNSELNIRAIEWISEHREGYDCALESSDVNKKDDYEFTLEVGGAGAWNHLMPRGSVGDPSVTANYYTKNLKMKGDVLPQFNIRLQDKLDNSGDAKYINHLDEPERVKIYLEGKTKDENNNEQTYEYTILVDIIYHQGPSFSGSVDIQNCALPGERIGFSSKNIIIKTPEMMPVTASSWELIPLKEVDELGKWTWDLSRSTKIDESLYEVVPDGYMEGSIPALYKQNDYSISYVFTAGGKEFRVMPKQGAGVKQEKSMMVIHNYHRMKEVVPQDMQIETMPVINGRQYAEAKIYIEDEADLRAFVEYLNMAKAGNAQKIPVGLKGLDIILQNDITLTAALPAMTQQFAGTFHGDGYHIDLSSHASTLFGNKLQGKIYNLGLIGGTIASTGQVVNSYLYKAGDDFQYGHKAYELSHAFTPETDHNDYGDYVATYYANGDYQYATTDRAWSIRTEAPNYGSTNTRHDMQHAHDAARWDGTAAVNKPLYDGTRVVADRSVESGTDKLVFKGLPEGYANDYLFFGQHLDRQNADAYPMHINQIATGDDSEKLGGNRVYEAHGYYQSKQIGQFYYNKDAWALKPTLTALDFNHMTAEGDGADPLPKTFSVDSNKDYTGSAYDNAATGHVTQNLLVYNAGQSVFNHKDVAGIAEKDVVYHNIVKTAEGLSTAYFHLVDKQDFNAPLAFDVNTLAWYERQPGNYRNDDKMGWEGICIPFTADRVFAMAENPADASPVESEISHFYGTELDCAPSENDHTLHHEYWLNGMVARGTDVAFARPSTEGAGLFTEVSQHTGDYEYKNDYFIQLPDYMDYYGTRDDDVYGETNDKPWYAVSHTFKDYVYLTSAVPYVVSFPGEDYYEFGISKPVTFQSKKCTIAVSDDEKCTTTVGSAKHIGTYMRYGMGSTDLGIDSEGNEFADAATLTLPFRTYVRTSSLKPIPIGYGVQHEDEEEEASLEKSIRIYGQGGILFIETNYADDVNIYSTSGQYLRSVHVEPGVNRFNGFTRGIYVVGNTKVAM